MAWVKIVNGVVVQKSCSHEEGFVDVDSSIVCGMLYDGAVFSMPNPPTATIPISVSMRQARLALLRAGKLDTVNSSIENIPGTEGDEARITWEFAATIERKHPLVESFKEILRLSDTDMDELFTLAYSL